MLTMLTLLTHLPRGPGNRCTALPRRMFARAGTGRRHGRSPAPAGGRRTPRKRKPSGTIRASRLALWRARWIRQLCMRPGRAGEPQSAEEAGCRRPMPHSAADHLERRKGQSRSVHVGRHTSRLKPRTSSGRVFDSPPFYLFVGTRISVEKPLKNSTNACYFHTTLYWRFALIFAAEETC
jgi:hypothetical protein